MGYTHYWSFNVPRGKSKDLEKKYQLALKQCAKFVKAWQDMESGDHARLSGYTVHTPIGAYGGLKVNGKGEYAHEDFIMREHLKDTDGGFCKTARKPYDSVVTGCLGILKYYPKDAIEVSSDGQYKDFFQGCGTASTTLKKNILIPIPKETNNE